MIISKDTNPERDVYYLGAKLIDIISKENEMFDFFEVYKKINISEKVSMNLYSLTLDWLYIMGVVDSSEEGGVRKCF